jgi:DNA primase
VNGLFPHPSRERASHLLLVEGPPDALAARSRGLPAIALPGAHSWQPEWSLLFAGRSVAIVLDCDAEGRAAARRIEQDLAGVALSVEVLDLDPARDDGFDLTDWLLTKPDALVPLAQFRACLYRRSLPIDSGPTA